jgi:SAM-dependent methyltransferase
MSEQPAASIDCGRTADGLPIGLQIAGHRHDDLGVLQAWLPGVLAGRRVLEVAAGTGWWTVHGARDAAFWLATDAQPETLAVARAKPMPPAVRFATADAYSLAELGAERFDAAFAGCWWSHVPLQRLPGWLALLHSRLAPKLLRLTYGPQFCHPKILLPIRNNRCKDRMHPWPS